MPFNPGKVIYKLHVFFMPNSLFGLIRIQKFLSENKPVYSLTISEIMFLANNLFYNLTLSFKSRITVSG